MIQRLALLFFTLFACHAHARTYLVNADHSQIFFSVPYLKVSEVTGAFQTFRGEIRFDQQNLVPENVYLIIDTASLTTHDQKRDHHLQKEDFFWTSKYPTLSFQSDEITPSQDDEGPFYQVNGDLLFQDRLYPQSFKVRHLGDQTDPWGKLSRFYAFEGSLSREELGLKWNQLLDTGELLVGDQVSLYGRLQLQESGKTTPFSTHMVPGPRAGTTHSVVPLPRELNLEAQDPDVEAMTPPPMPSSRNRRQEVQSLSLDGPFWALLFLSALAFIAIVGGSLYLRHAIENRYQENPKWVHVADLLLLLLVFAFAIAVGEVF